MKYQSGQRRKAIEYEKDLANWWKKHQIFGKSISQRSIDDSYVFYDGPPFLTGLPHHGHLLGSTIKDVVGRYQTMKGKRVERVWGWDCHGLPAENYVEKKLGITDRRDIGTKWSLEEYILTAKKSMEEISDEWEHTITRIGRWVEFKGAYRTMDKDFMESVWWAFKQLYDAGRIYEGRKVLMYDTKFATPVSKNEVTMDNDAYQTVTDPSAYVKFKIDSKSLTKINQKTAFSDRNYYLLAWTTTPWTLPANVCLAINPSLEYGFYEIENEVFIAAVDRAKLLFEGQSPVQVLSGQDLVGLKYHPIIEVDDSLFDLNLRGDKPSSLRPDTYHVLAADFVSDTDGTGIVHIAPAYGENDYELTKSHEIDFIDCLDQNGYYLPKMQASLNRIGVRNIDESGIQIWAANKFLAKVLQEQQIVWRIDYIKHEYPFNPRSKERIIYRAFPSWFLDVENSKQLMLEENQHINWFPDYLKHGRFAKNIEAAPDWNLSRDRFWATAMPVWKGNKGSVKVVGSYDELYQLSGVRLEDYHRPWVDEIEFEIDGEHFHRIEKVLDCWFESGSMPFAQMHYPFENKEKFENNYPADFIVEYVGQVRAWFYYVHCLGTNLAEIGAFGNKAKATTKNAFKNVITTGTIAGNDGRKMSKSIGNFTDPNLLMDQFSADALRFLLLSSPVCAGEDFALLDKDVSDVNRKLSMIWNVYDFFTTYASVDGVDSDTLKDLVFDNLTNPLDRWIISKIHQLRNEITNGMDEYNIPKALENVLPFVDDLSNWFVRRSRRRFWKTEDDADKTKAYQTLYYVLVYLSRLLAPFVPFLAEELYKNMTGDGNSVHLLDWPEPGTIDQQVLNDMAKAREIIANGLRLRMCKSESEDQIKVRQPLAKLTYNGEKLTDFYEQMILDEVNVKAVEFGEVMELDKKLTDKLLSEGYAREVIRAVQSARKKANLLVDDRIHLSLSVELDPEWREAVMQETLATTLELNKNYAFDIVAKINQENITISLEKI